MYAGARARACVVCVGGEGVKIRGCSFLHLIILHKNDDIIIDEKKMEHQACTS